METHPLTGLEDLGLVTPHNPRPAVPTLRETEATCDTLDVYVDVDVNQQVLIESAGGDSLPDIPLPYVPRPDVPLPKVCPNGLVGQK